jgi:hypothetical protein
MLTLVTTLVLAAGPRVELVERNSMGLDAKTAALLRERVRKAMVSEGLDAVVVPQPCTDTECLRTLARAHDVVVVGMTIVKSRKGFTIDLEAVDLQQQVLLQTFVIADERVERSPDAQVFARELALKLAAPEPAPKKDVPLEDPPPKKVTLEPPARLDPEPVLVERAPVPAAPRVVLVSSAVVAAAGVAMIVGGAVSAAQLERSLQETPVVTTLTRPQAQAQADGANALMGFGTAAFVAGSLGIITGVALIAGE